MNSNSPRPNILFLFSDQHRADAMGCAGHPVVKTPNLDRLAAEGVHFENAYCSTPLCMPSRVSLATGRFPHNTGNNTNNEGYLYPDTPMLSHSLHDAGYRTALLGKLHMCQCAHAGSPECDRWCRDAGWDDAMPIHGKAWSCVYEEDQWDEYLRWLASIGKLEAFRQDYRERNFAWKFPGIQARPAGYAAPSPLEPEEHQDGFITRKACEWLENVSREQPWFCWVNWGGPHDPWDAPGKFGRMYDPAAMPPPIADTLENAPEKLRKHAEKHTGKIAPEQWRKVMAQYFGSISFIDDGIGKILDVLEARGLVENTIVVYSSDHGEMMFDHRMLHKELMYEASSKVPLLVRLPGGERRRVDAPVSLLDLVPTLLNLAGVERQAMPVLHGTTLLPDLRGEARPERPVFCEMDKTKMIRQGSWKFSTDPEFDRDQLFNLDDDPNELCNLAAHPEHAERGNTFRKALLDWLINTQNVPMPRGRKE
jgi:arylsulfatase